MKARSSSSPIDRFDWRVLPEEVVVGIDEVGRGCLAGPVCAAAVVLPRNHSLQGLTDSKLISENRREEISNAIREQATVGLGFASVEEVDRLNVLQATFIAMKRALLRLNGLKLDVARVHLLVDGNMKIPGLNSLQTCLVKGDLRAEPISAASIVAKVARDQLMRHWHIEYPEFGFDENKGYGSEKHRKAIAKLGPTWLHRKSFGGVREFWTSKLDHERARQLSRELGGDESNFAVR